MLTLSAQPKNAISSPANGSTGQKPCAAIKPATPKDTKHTLPKNSTAARMLSEQFGQFSMRCGSGCTDSDRGFQRGAKQMVLREIFYSSQKLRRESRRPNCSPERTSACASGSNGNT